MQLYSLNNVAYLGFSVIEFGIIIALLVVGYVMFIAFYMSIKRYAPEARVLAYCRKNRLDMIRVFDNDDHEEMYPAKIERKGDPIYKERVGFGIQLVPAMQSKALTSRTRDGLAIHNFSVNFPFSIAPKNAMAVKTVLDYASGEDKFKELSFLPNNALMTLIGTPRDDLEDDIGTYIDLYEPDIEKDNFVELIKALQEDLSIYPLKTGAFSFRMAFENITEAFTAQDLHQVIQLVERKAREKMLNEDRQLKLLIYGGVAFSAVMLSAALAFHIIK